MSAQLTIRRDGWLRRRYHRSALGRVLTRAGDRLMRRHVEWVYATTGPHLRPGRLLDVGAWDCRVSALLRDRGECEVTAVDVVDRNRTDVPLVVYDGTRMPLGDGEFDTVTILYVLHHAADDLAILCEARRVCAPGGRVIVAEDRADTRSQRALAIGFHLWLLSVTGMGWKGAFRTTTAWRERFAAAGLAVESVHPLGPHMGRRLWPRNILFVLTPA